MVLVGGVGALRDVGVALDDLCLVHVRVHGVLRLPAHARRVVARAVRHDHRGTVARERVARFKMVGKDGVAVGHAPAGVHPELRDPGELADEPGELAEPAFRSR